MSTTLPPFFGRMRLAQLADLPRIGVVAAAGFYHSPVFQYQRVFHNEYPRDTLASYRAQFHEEILDDGGIVVVIEDKYDPAEADKTYDALRNIYPRVPDLGADNTVIVGIGSITLSPSSPRRGAQQDLHSLETLTDPDNQKRDVSAEGERRYAEACAPAKKEWLAGRMRAQTLVVHPAYWGRGHGKALAHWMSILADEDGETVGVSAAKMGVSVFEREGYELKENVVVKGYDKHPEDINLWIGQRQPAAKEAKL